MDVGSRKTSSRGFTLVELMVVVGIIALVTAATIPSFSLALARNRQSEAGQLIIEAVFVARSSAARTGRCYRVMVNTDTPNNAGGTGGSVIVSEYIMPTADCGGPFNDGTTANWNVVSQKFVGGTVDGTRAMLVGRDVAIRRLVSRPGCSEATNEPLYFNVDGSLYFAPGAGAAERFYEISAFQSDGTSPLGVSRHVKIANSGQVSYTVCR